MISIIDNKYKISVHKTENKKLNILLMYNTFGIGGVENILKNIIKIYYKSYNFYFIGNNDIPDKYKSFFIKTFKLDFLEDEEPDKIKKRQTEFYNIFKNNKIDIFYNHFYYYKYQKYDIETAKSCNVKTILHFHNSYAIMFTQSFIYKYMPYMYEAFRMYDKIICLSKKSEEFFKIINQNSKYFPNIYNPELDNINITTKRNGILWVGRLDLNQKRPFDAIEIFKKILEYKSDIRITMCYSTNEWTDSIEKELFQKIDDTKLRNKIILIRDKHDSDIWNLMCEHEILIYTSIFDGYPMTIVEAEKCGMKIIAYEQPDCELLKCKDIIKVPSKDTSKMSEQIIYVLDHKNKNMIYEIKNTNLEDILA